MQPSKSRSLFRSIIPVHPSRSSRIIISMLELFVGSGFIKIRIRIRFLGSLKSYDQNVLIREWSYLFPILILASTLSTRISALWCEGTSYLPWKSVPWNGIKRTTSVLLYSSLILFLGGEMSLFANYLEFWNGNCIGRKSMVTFSGCCSDRVPNNF